MAMASMTVACNVNGPGLVGTEAVSVGSDISSVSSVGCREKSPSAVSLAVVAGEEGGDEESWTRRGVMGSGVLAILGSLSMQGAFPPEAFSFGISGPKEWLKEQKQKTSSFLIAPITASRYRLNEVATILSGDTTIAGYEEAGSLVKVAARDCMLPEPGSLLYFQTRIGVEVCTFQLVLKNASSLLNDNDPVKLNAKAALEDLISSFVVLDGLIVNGAGGPHSKESLMDALRETTVALDRFEDGVQDCLGTERRKIISGS